MTITIKWWMISILLIVAPILYGTLKPHEGDYDMEIDVLVLTAACWAAAIGLTIGKLL